MTRGLLRMTALLALTAPSFVASLVSAAPAETSTSSTDRKLEKTIKAKLQRDAQLGDNRIDVQIQDGVVVLKGTVDTAREQAKAARLALVKDVVGVDNRLQVASKDSTRATADADLAGNVRAKIAGIMGSDGEDVVVEVKNGVVTLSGSVPSRAAHDEAVDLASTTDRVRRVDDELHVIAPPAAP